MNGIATSIVSWHPVLTDHQSHTLQALAAASGTPVTVMVGRLEDPTRKAQGWTPADAGTLDVRLLAADVGLPGVRAALREHRAAVHVFGSPFDQPRFIAALFMALSMGLRVYLISEPYSPIAAGYLHDRRPVATRIKAWLRPWVYRCYGLLLRRRLRGVFAISQLAIRQYRAIGVPAQRIHPFGYFVPRSNAPARAVERAPQEPCRAVFVGNLIATKGLHELSAAARRVAASGVPLQIDVYGAGDPSTFAFDGDVIRHAGRIPFGQAQQVIAGYDFLVLPSRYDGWGVVVNEAILAGVPVLCSDRVGAGAFVRRWDCGTTCAAESVDALAGALAEMAQQPARRQRMREACLRVRDRLDPIVAGRYMADVMRSGGTGAAPPNPWYDA